MFSIILYEVASYFDRRALISAFFPSMVFWGLVVIIVLAQEIGWSAALSGWGGLSSTAQALLLIAFFVWIPFWTFLTLNFRTAMVRLYEGYWPNAGISTILFERQRKRWQKRFKKLEDHDRELEDQENVLVGGREEYEELRRSLETALAETERAIPEDAKLVGEELDAFLEKVEATLKELEDEPPLVTKLMEIGESVWKWWQRLAPYLNVARGGEEGPWSQRRDRLNNCTRNLEKMVKLRLGEVEEQRLRLDHEIFHYYPPHRSDVMPTKLGNVLKAAEMYAQERYHLDAVLIWPRLQSALPKEFADPLQDAKTSLDLMVTLSAFTLLFGLPLSVWLAVKSSTPLLWWIPLILAVVAFSLRCYMSVIFALAALVLTFVPFSFTLSISTPVAQFQAFFTLAASVLFLAWLIYQNAVQAGLAYGEKIKAAFDLYRWKVLEGLHIQLPKDFEEERKIWEEVCGLLYRGYPPDSRYFRYVQEANRGTP